jgi:carboxyl-terminal processing protease
VSSLMANVMLHQKRRSREWARTFLIPVLVVTGALVGGVYGPGTRVAAASTDDEINSSVKDFTSFYTTVQQNFAEPLSADKAIYNGAIPGMLRTLDPHSNFFDPKALQAMREEQRGHYYGVGMQVVGRTVGGVMNTIVVNPFVGSPAYKAGLRPNDAIVEVNDKNTVGMSSTEVADLLKGPRGTAVQVKVSRGESPEKLTFNLIRDEINRSSVTEAFMVKPGIGYIKLEEFIETTGADFDAALKKLDENQLRGLVLDLRGNPGGLLTEAVSVAGHLLPKGDVIVSHHGRASQERVYKASEGNHGFSYPIVVIVNRNSASASEIVSGSLQDHDRAWILGDNTFGKGLVQTVYPLSNDTALALTTAKYYTPSGRLIQRDYSAVSFFDYYYRTNTTARNTADMKTTDSGRVVYGGGGISPDEKYEVPKPGPLEIALATQYMVPNYTKHFFSVHPGPLAAGWNMDATQMADFQNWLKDQKFTFTDADFTKAYEPIRRALQEDIYRTGLNNDAAMKYQYETDPEVLAAVAALPHAQTLLNTASEVRAQKAQK